MKTFRLSICLLSVVYCSTTTHAQTLDWIDQFGTSDTERSHSVSADGLGNVYISGRTKGGLGGPNAGGNDVFLSKYDASGTLEWTRQFGTSESDYGYEVSADGLGNVYISGQTRGSLGGPNAGDFDAFVAKFVDLTPGDANGDGKVDGKVDGTDYLTWAFNFGDDPADDPPGAPANGDFDYNGVVNSLDYLTWASNFGHGQNDGVAVPEPSCFAILLVGCLTATIRRCRRGSR